MRRLEVLLPYCCIAAVIALCAALTPRTLANGQLIQSQLVAVTRDVPPAPAGGATVAYYVSPTGSPTGAGTLDAPWDLASALNQPSRIVPGATVWLRGGTYRGMFTSRLAGAPNAPIVIRSYPGEWAVVCKNSPDDNVGVLTVRGPWVCFRDLEITNAYADRNRLDPEGKVDPWRGSGVNIFAPNVKLINAVLHDNGHGVGLWNEEGGAEIYGCLMYYNGNNKKDHGIYAHNKTGTQVIRDNLIFSGAGYGMHVYANNPRVSINGFLIEGNAVFNNGALTREDQAADQILVGGVAGVPARRITLRDNYIYAPVDTVKSKSRGLRLGYRDEGNEDVTLTNNYLVGRVPLKVSWWKRVVATGNTIFSPDRAVDLTMPMGVAPTAYRWENNKYLTAERDPKFSIGAVAQTGLAAWQSASGLDRESRVVQGASGKPRGVHVFVRPNRYEPGRGHVVVYNWDLKETVSVDVGSILEQGASYEVRDAQNYFGTPVAKGTYTGQPLSLPMKLTTVARPVGNVERTPVHTGPQFAAFVIRQVR